MSKIFNMISKGQGKGAVSGGSVERVTPLVQLEIPLDLPSVHDDKEPVQMKRRPYKKTGVVHETDARDATIAGLRDQIGSLQRKIGQHQENDGNQALVAVKREAEATKQLLERTQRELEEAREWQSDPGAPKFRQRETELLGKIEKMIAEFAAVSSELERAKGELAGLRGKQSELVRENEGIKVELSEAVRKLSQKEAEQAEQKPEPEPVLLQHDADDGMSAAMDAAARENLLKGEARSGRAKRNFYYAAAGLLLLLSIAGFYYRQSIRPAASMIHAVSGEPGLERIEHKPDLAETVDKADLLVMPPADASAFRTDTPSSSDGWPSLDLPGVKVERTANACFVTFQQGLFVKESEFSENGRTALASVSRALAPYSGELRLIVVGHTDLSADSGHDHGTLSVKRAHAVKEILVSKAYFPDESIIVRTASAPSFSVPHVGDDMKNRNRTVDIRLVRKSSIVRE